MSEATDGARWEWKYDGVDGVMVYLPVVEPPRIVVHDMGKNVFWWLVRQGIQPLGHGNEATREEAMRAAEQCARENGLIEAPGKPGQRYWRQPDNQLGLLWDERRQAMLFCATWTPFRAVARVYQPEDEAADWQPEEETPTADQARSPRST